MQLALFPRGRLRPPPPPDLKNGYEIAIDKISVNGKSYKISPIGGYKKLAQIKDGKWFWIGERYLYRSDEGRRPKGVTEKFKIGIPIGKNRSIEFFANNKSGIVEVSFGGKSQTAVLYSQQDKKVKVKIENSGKTALRKTAAVKVLYSVLLFALFAMPSFFFCRYYFKNPKKVKNWIFRHRFILIVSGAALGMLVFMIRNSVYVGMWLDTSFISLEFWN
jgi:hypothetical protein